MEEARPCHCNVIFELINQVRLWSFEFILSLSCFVSLFVGFVGFLVKSST